MDEFIIECNKCGEYWSVPISDIVDEMTPKDKRELKEMLTEMGI